MKRNPFRPALAVLVVLLLVILPVAGSFQAPAPTMHPWLIARAQKGGSYTTTTPSGYSPSQIRAAYAVNGTGAGQTIAIVTAYGSANIASDLATFDKQFGLRDPSLTVVKQALKIQANSGWALETALDVEWSHAMAPDAAILLVVAKSASVADLMWAVDYAAAHAQVVSMSWGANEFSSETTYDAHFKTGPLYVASSGDNGAGAGWPAASSLVVAVGGTSLKMVNGAYGSETAWSGSGGGTSAYEAKPTWQAAPVVNDTGTKREIPDVSFVGDPNTGVAVYDSVLYNGQKGWFVLGGTSVGAPCWAGLLAIQNAKGELSGGADATFYSHAASAWSTWFHDIVSGSNGYPAVVGYDPVTGIGSPVSIS